MSNLEQRLLTLRVKDLREIAKTLDLKGRSGPKTKQSLVDFIINAQQTRIVTKKRLLEEIKKYAPRKTPKAKTPKTKTTSADLRTLLEQRSAVNLKKVASVFGIRVGRKKKANLISTMLLSVDRDALQKEVRKYPVLKKYQKQRKPTSPLSEEEMSDVPETGLGPFMERLKREAKAKLAKQSKKDKKRAAGLKKWKEEEQARKAEELKKRKEEAPQRKRSPKPQRKRPSKEEKIFKARTFGKVKDYFESAARFKKEMVLECAPYGLSTHEMDEEHVALMNINIDAEYFERYRCPKAFPMKMNVAEVSKRMKKVLKKDEVTMEVKGESLHFSIKNSRDGRTWSFSVPLLEFEYSPLSVPREEGEGFISMPSNKFYEMARELEKLGPSALFRGSKNRMDIYADDEETVFELENDYTYREVDEHDQTEVDVESDFEDVWLSTKYLLLFARSKKLSKRIVIKFYMEGLTSFEYWDSMWGLSRITYFLAPLLD